MHVLDGNVMLATCLSGYNMIISEVQCINMLLCYIHSEPYSFKLTRLFTMKTLLQN